MSIENNDHYWWEMSCNHYILEHIFQDRMKEELKETQVRFETCLNEKQQISEGAETAADLSRQRLENGMREKDAEISTLRGTIEELQGEINSLKAAEVEARNRMVHAQGTTFYSKRKS